MWIWFLVIGHEVNIYKVPHYAIKAFLKPQLDFASELHKDSASIFCLLKLRVEIKVIIEKSRGEVSLVDKDAFENVS